MKFGKIAKAASVVTMLVMTQTMESLGQGEDVSMGHTDERVQIGDLFEFDGEMMVHGEQHEEDRDLLAPVFPILLRVGAQIFKKEIKKGLKDFFKGLFRGSPHDDISFEVTYDSATSAGLIGAIYQGSREQFKTCAATGVNIKTKTKFAVNDRDVKGKEIFERLVLFPTVKHVKRVSDLPSSSVIKEIKIKAGKDIVASKELSEITLDSNFFEMCFGRPTLELSRTEVIDISIPVFDDVENHERCVNAKRGYVECRRTFCNAFQIRDLSTRMTDQDAEQAMGFRRCKGILTLADKAKTAASKNLPIVQIGR